MLKEDANECAVYELFDSEVSEGFEEFIPFRDDYNAINESNNGGFYSCESS